jgi:hypothetical protein
LVELLTTCEPDGGPILAERLNAGVGNGLAWAGQSRVFFQAERLSSPAQQTMFPFQIPLRSLPPEVEAKLWKQLPRWLQGLQARVFTAAA